ncbi:hypothetical protein H1D32_02305 [Anaerobacillus sp. CMMVII]|uniref:hypothetical protein n=1 Tax=Anaerobacillus sp. CMMVII TaxID=2755588 RepID=UPI0021B765B5|nr:hypothetical protein [Anaerobacillus sp. CMMVII]MCT8136681.1 hypothetical protein [Anaerobacillus sp. CMMVII]
MPYFERILKLSKQLFGLAGFLFILTFVSFIRSNFDEVLIYNYTNDIWGTIMTVSFFLLALVSIVLGIALRYVAQDVRDYLKYEKNN